MVKVDDRLVTADTTGTLLQLLDTTNPSESAATEGIKTPVKTRLRVAEETAGTTLGVIDATDRIVRLPAVMYGDDGVKRAHSWYDPGVAPLALITSTVDAPEPLLVAEVLATLVGERDEGREQDAAMMYAVESADVLGSDAPLTTTVRLA